MNILTTLISPVTNLINGWGERRLRVKEIEEIRHVKVIQGIQDSEASEFAADAKRAESLIGSWKDEYITIVVSIPAILCFIGDWGAAIVASGFTSLTMAPDWYQYLLVDIFSVGSGVPLAGKAVKTLKKISSM